MKKLINLSFALLAVALLANACKKESINPNTVNRLKAPTVAPDPDPSCHCGRQMNP